MYVLLTNDKTLTPRRVLEAYKVSLPSRSGSSRAKSVHELA